MLIVIDISDKVYGLLKYFEKSLGLNDKKDRNDDVKTALMRAVINGTPLPDTNVGDMDCIKDSTTDSSTDSTTISRQAVVDRINKLIEVEKKQGTDDWGYGRERVNAYEAILHFVESEYMHPSVEPERKVGHWIEHEWAQELDGEGYLISNFECDKCHAWAEADYVYCPNCGVKMEAGE